MIDTSILEETLGLRVLYFDEIPSTSLYCRERIKNGSPFEGLVIAGHQTNGQGRVGKSFFSPKDTGLYLTFSLKSPLFHKDDLTPRMALATCHAIDEVFSTFCGVKWVNDIYINKKKVAGILCQNCEDYVLIGIGINLTKPLEIPAELSSRIGWITDRVDAQVKKRLIKVLYQNIVTFASLDRDPLLAEYRHRCVHLGSPVEIELNNVLQQGICIGIGDQFELLVKIDDEIQSFSSGFMILRI